jgi:regulator of sigma E protease
MILSVDGTPLFSAPQLGEYLKEKNNKTVTLGVQRKSAETFQVEVTALTPLQPQGRDPMIGVSWAQLDDADVRVVYPNPITQIKDTFQMMWMTISKVADPRSSIGVDHLSGPVGIGQMLYSLLQTENGWRRILGFMVIFNVNLAVLNMLPLPVLDGGHITLALLEKIFGRPVQAKVLEVIQTGCALGLMGLMLYVTSKDIGDKFGRGASGKKEQEIVFPQ